MAKLITTLGPVDAFPAGIILPHEHVFTDTRTPDTPGHGEAEMAEVIEVMSPQIARAQAAGIVALVECTPVGVGRRAEFLKAVSLATGFPLVVPTGIYREPWIPPWAREAEEGALRDWMTAELLDEIEGSGVQAGWIKLSAGDDGITPTEAKILRAAAVAGAVTHAAIGSHTIRGRVVREQLDIVERLGYSPERFIWIHAHVEPDLDLHLEIARRGAWLEYDAIGSDQVSDVVFLQLIRHMLEAGLGDRVLLSHDRGWYDPARPRGGTPQPYIYLSEQFLPKVKAAGIDEATIHQLTCINPFRAFAR